MLNGAYFHICILYYAVHNMHQITKDCTKQHTSLDSSKNIAYYVHVDFFCFNSTLTLQAFII